MSGAFLWQLVGQVLVLRNVWDAGEPHAVLWMHKRSHTCRKLILASSCSLDIRCSTVWQGQSSLVLQGSSSPQRTFCWWTEFLQCKKLKRDICGLTMSRNVDSAFFQDDTILLVGQAAKLFIRIYSRVITPTFYVWMLKYFVPILFSKFCIHLGTEVRK